MYHISVTTTTDESGEFFEVRKNNNILVPQYIPHRNDQTVYNSGTITTVVHMNVNDTIDIWKGHVDQYEDFYSCLTTVKL